MAAVSLFWNTNMAAVCHVKTFYSSSIGKHFRDKHSAAPKDLTNNFRVLIKHTNKFDWLVYGMFLFMYWNQLSGPVYTGPDKYLHGQKFHLAFTRDQQNWKNFWPAKCASLRSEKGRSTFWPARFRFCTNSCKHPNRASLCSDNAVEAWNLALFLPGCLAKVKQQSKTDWAENLHGPV